jgi:DNA recombination protein RmuC
MLCVDAKFPMENFTKMHNGETEMVRAAAKRDFMTDVKKHVSDISKKYILPEEGTLDFALMYIPSEAVYYEIANTESLMDFSRRQRVYPVSPNTLYAHLQVLLLSFQGKDLEQKSRQVFQLLRAIEKDFGKVQEHLGVLSRHVGNAYNSIGTVSDSVAVLGQKITKSHLIEASDEDEPTETG